MKIGIANRDGIVDKLDLAELRDAGVESIEIYSAPNSLKLPERIQKLVDEGFEPVVHLGGFLTPSAILFFMENTHEFDTLRRVVVHPAEHGLNRAENEYLTFELCRLLAAADADKFCLENLPYDPTVPRRFGDNLGDVFEVAKATGIKNCFDTGHYFSGRGGKNFSPFRHSHAERIEHLHVHAYVNNEDHHPLQDDRKGDLRRLIERFVDRRPNYSGVFSIEIIPFGRTDHDAVYGSIEALKYYLRERD